MEVLSGPLPTGPLFMKLPQPLLLLAEGRRLLAGNAAALALRDEGGLLLCAGRLMRLGSLDASALEALLQQARLQGATRWPLWFAAGHRAAWLDLQRLPDGRLLLSLQLDEPALLQQARLEALCARARISPAERSVLHMLGDGENPQSAAARLGLRLSTVRSHVRSLLAKTGSRSLLELLRCLGSASALPT